MMKVELGLLPLSHGSATVLGAPAGQANASIGYVPQNYAAGIESNLTAEQSVLLGLNGTRFGLHPTTRTQRAKAYQAMEFVGIADKAKYRLSELSGGLRQRVAIAQAIVCDPKLLMLDEPLANLDLASQRSVVHLLNQLNRDLGMTIQVVAHDLNMLLPILTGAVYLLDGIRITRICARCSSPTCSPTCTAPTCRWSPRLRAICSSRPRRTSLPTPSKTCTPPTSLHTCIGIPHTDFRRSDRFCQHCEPSLPRPFH